MLEMAYVLFIERRFELNPTEPRSTPGGSLLSSELFSRWYKVFYFGVWFLFFRGKSIEGGYCFGFRGHGSDSSDTHGALVFLFSRHGDGGFRTGFGSTNAFGIGIAIDLESTQGSAMGAYQSVQSLARVIGPLGAGLLFDFAGENAPYQVAAILTVWALWRAREVSSPTA